MIVKPTATAASECDNSDANCHGCASMKNTAGGDLEDSTNWWRSPRTIPLTWRCTRVHFPHPAVWFVAACHAELATLSPMETGETALGRALLRAPPVWAQERFQHPKTLP